MTSNLPSGTVTFLFTDIEGSTRLSQEYPDEIRALVARHNEILENAIRTQNGYIFNIVGDSYHAAFQEAEQALHAALEAQRHLYQEAWSPAPIKVRMGIHTGAANLEDENSASPYSGYATLSLTSRVMSAGHGGQILLSQGSVDQLEGKLAHIELKDMGEHHLKDILRPQQIHQVVVQDLPTEFPPLAAQKSINHNLPLNLTSFIGREREISEIKTRLGESRLFTLTGPGGTGKTRLSIQVGGELLAEQPDGVWIVELAPLADPALIPQTVAAVFGLRESPNRALIEQINDYLRAKRLLLILDNCEHLVDACARLAESLLQACPNIKIFASSREALGVRGETTYRVPSLYLPDPGQVTAEAVLRCESVQLFVDRASAVNPNFQVTDKNAAFVAQICRRLDGIPLALELAAARARVLSVEQIAERLDDRFRLLTGGSRTVLPRQQTLRALIDWSYALLTEKEKILFRRLAVFTGGWTLEAAEEVCSEVGLDKYEILDLMTQLVDKSLTITEEKNGQVR
jgi:predicted ATPase/class 3 adenylate cyclase